MTRIPVHKIDLHKIEGQEESATYIGADVWKQANRILQVWSTYGNRNNKVNFVITYEDGYVYRGRLELPWFESAFQRTEPYRNLGEHILDYLEYLPQFLWFSQQTRQQARQDVLTRLDRYEVGDPVLQDKYVIRIQSLDFSQ